jgi:autotransporter-associated beta strand protein
LALQQFIKPMKTYKFSRSLFSLFRSQAFPCAITLSLLAAGSASAADGTWTGGTSVTWATATNWSDSIVPGGSAANSDLATFNSGTYSFAPTAVNGYFIGGLIFGSSNGAITLTTGTGNNRLNVGSAGILVNAGSGAVSIGAASSQGASIVANQNWANNSSSLLTANRVSVDDNSSAGTYTLTINGSGSGGVNFSNTIGDVNGASDLTRLFALQINSTGGNTTISTINTFTGGTTLTQGNLLLGNNAALGTGSLALNGGKISSNATGARTPANNTTIGGNVTLGDAVNTGKLTFSGTMGLGGDTRTLTTDSLVEFSGVVSNGGITKQGASTLTFLGSSANTYSGLTTVSAGGLTLSKTAAVDAITGNVLVNGTGALTLAAADQINNASNVEVAAGTLALVTFNDTVNGVKLTGGTVTGTTGVLTSSTAFDFQSSTNVTGILAGTAGANKTTAGTVTFTGGNANTYTGLTTVSAGSLVLGRTAGVVALAGNALVNGGTLQITNSNQITDSANLEVATNGTFAMAANSDTVNNLKLTGGEITGSGTLTSSTAFDFQSSGNVSAVLAGAAGANKTTAGTVTFTGSNANTYTGLTTVSEGSLVLSKTPGVVALAGDALVNGGTLRIAGADQITNTANVEVATGGTFALGGNTNTVNGVKLTGGTITGTGINGILTSITAYDLQSGSSSAILAGTAGATKTTAGTVTLTKANTYTGATTVSNGALIVEGSISTSSLTTVQSGATLGGSGTVGALTVDNGAFHTPGSSPGIQNTGNYSNAGTLAIEINGVTVGTDYDQVKTTGTVTLSGLLSITMGYTPADNALFFILANDGADAISGTFSNASINGNTYTLGGQDFAISYFGDSVNQTFTGGNDVVLRAVVIPEPRAALLGSLGMLILLRRRRYA